MQLLTKGEYTGEIVNKAYVDDSIITNTYYSEKKNNPSWHYHENLIVCFVFDGVKGKVETNNGVKHVEKGGSIFFFYSEEKHRWVSPSNVSKSANLEISPEFLKKYNLSEDCIKNAIFNNVDSKSLMLKMQQEMLNTDMESKTAIQSILLDLVCKDEKLKSKDIPHWVVTLYELLQDNWDRKMTLVEMSLIVNVHPVTISKFFRKYFSYTLGEYQRKLKIERSINLIKNPNLSLSEIAYICGFSDQSHFIRNFKLMTGFLPNQFKQF